MAHEKPASRCSTAGLAGPSTAKKQSDREYLEEHALDIYLTDVTKLLLKARDEQPLEFIAEYFNAVLTGTHVLLRDFKYVFSCTRNRWDFMRGVREAFEDIPTEQRVSAREMTDMLQMLCPDFPLELVLNAALLCGDETKPKFHSLLHAVFVRFYFAEFLERIAKVFSTCDTRGSGQVNRNVLCLTLRQMMAKESDRRFAPSADVFDQVLQEAPDKPTSDATLLELQRDLVAAPAVHAALAADSSTQGDSLIPSQKKVASARARTAGSNAISRLLDEMSEAEASPIAGGKRGVDRRRGSSSRKLAADAR